MCVHTLRSRSFPWLQMIDQCFPKSKDMMHLAVETRFAEPFVSLWCPTLSRCWKNSGRLHSPTRSGMTLSGPRGGHWGRVLRVIPGDRERTACSPGVTERTTTGFSLPATKPKPSTGSLLISTLRGAGGRIWQLSNRGSSKGMPCVM